MDPDDWWAALIEDLRSWAVEVDPRSDGVHVLWTWPGGAPREATLVVTPEEWDGVVGIFFGSLELALTDLRDQMEALSGPQRYLVHRDYGFLPSATPELPAKWAHLPDVGSGHGGHWFVVDADGTEHPLSEDPPSPR